MENRVSKVSVREVVGKYLSDELLSRVMADIERAASLERAGQIGMTYGEWKERFDDNHSPRWAANTQGFGKAGAAVGGDCDDCRIVSIVSDGETKVLLLWDDLMGVYDEAEKPYLIKPTDGMLRIIGDYRSLKDCAVDANEKFGLRAYDIFRWSGCRKNGEPLWALARKVR